MKVNIALNGKIYEDAWNGESLEELAAEWKEWAAEDENKVFYYASAMQIVYKDKNVGSVLTAWVDNPSDCVSFQVLEMG